MKNKKTNITQAILHFVWGTDQIIGKTALLQLLHSTGMDLHPCPGLPNYTKLRLIYCTGNETDGLQNLPQVDMSVILLLPPLYPRNMVSN